MNKVAVWALSATANPVRTEAAATTRPGGRHDWPLARPTRAARRAAPAPPVSRTVKILTMTPAGTGNQDADSEAVGCHAGDAVRRQTQPPLLVWPPLLAVYIASGQAQGSPSLVCAAFARAFRYPRIGITRYTHGQGDSTGRSRTGSCPLKRPISTSPSTRLRNSRRYSSLRMTCIGSPS